eukprot:TRINITY_DN1620_c3_g2_i2.p2 TRINITY_DN1620_c3_g2~~TRINITY_DN1620_c3_g2_i2.p2  ORF type:complete len:914 (+),score=395.68 TRINITY_DN1620_c3_g2_i2:55-2796(+)
MAFTPNEEHYKQVLGLLEQASNPSSEVVRAVWEQFIEYSQRPDFNCYLAVAMADKSLPVETRQWGAIVLKNGLSTNYAAIRSHVAFIQSNLMVCIGDPAKDIRNAVANSISVLTSCLEAGAESAQLLSLLVEAVKSPDVMTAQGAAKALHNICEDRIELLFVGGAALAGALLPPLLQGAGHADPQVRENCMWGAVNLCTGCHELVIQQLVIDFPPFVVAGIDDLLRCAMQLAMDPPNTQIAVCRAFAFVAETYPQKLEPRLKDIYEYLIMIQDKYQASNPSLALEACDFWTAIVQDVCLSELFRSLFPRLVNSLLNCMRYGDMELSMIKAVEDDVTKPDRDQDVNPAFQGGRKTKTDTQDTPDDDDDDDDEEGEEEDEEDDDGYEGDWNLRRSSASTMDALGLCYGNGHAEYYLGVVIPELQKRLQPDNEWTTREAAILALGTMTEGLRSALHGVLPQLVGSLCETAARDSNFLIRSICAWTLGRFCEVAESHPDQSHLQAIFATLVGLLADGSKKVVSSACRALGRDGGVMESVVMTSESMRRVLDAVGRALHVVDSVNLKELISVVVGMCEAAGSNLDTPETVPMLMTPLAAKWESYANNDPRMVHVMAGMAAAATALGPSFQPWAQGCFERASAILQAAQAYRAQTEYRSDAEYVVSALDLHSGLLDGLESSVEPLWGAAPQLVQLVIQCLSDSSTKVRQSAFALLGDASKWCWPHMAPGTSQYLALIRGSCQLEHPMLCINVLYALGEIIMKVGANFRNIPGDVPLQVADVLIPLVNKKHSNPQIGENATVCLGRLGMMCTDVVAPRLESFAKGWCSHARSISDKRDREHAFNGMAKMVRVNPGGCYSSFAYLCDALCAYEADDLNPALLQEYATLLSGFKQHMGAGWDGYYQQFKPAMRQKLQVLFGL